MIKRDIDLTFEQRRRIEFIDALNLNLKEDKVCRIDIGKNSFELILTILQDLIPNKDNFELRIYDYYDPSPTFDLRTKGVPYKDLRFLKDIINEKNVTLRISNKRIIIDLGEAINYPNMFVSLNKQFSKWVDSRIEPCSFARMLKNNHNYFIIFRDKNFAIFFKEFCKNHNIIDFNSSEVQLNNFICRESGCLILGKQNGFVFSMSDHLSSSYYYCDEEKEYLIDLTGVLNEIYLSVKDDKEELINEGSKEEVIFESEIIKSQFIKGQNITVRYDGKNEIECLNALETLIKNAKITLEPKKLIIPQSLWDFLSPVYTKILFNHKNGELNCFTDNYQLTYYHESKLWEYEAKDCDDPNLAIFIPLGALREKVDVEGLEPQFALATRPSDK